MQITSSYFWDMPEYTNEDQFFCDIIKKHGEEMRYANKNTKNDPVGSYVAKEKAKAWSKLAYFIIEPVMP